MVEFYCEHCCDTLKKKQVINHSYHCYTPLRLFCVDCKISFLGNDYLKHTVCKTEAELTQGPYYKPKLKQTINIQQQHHQQYQYTKHSNHQSTIYQDTKQQQQIDQQSHDIQWKGWKNTLKHILKQQDQQKMKIKAIRKKIVKQYMGLKKELSQQQVEELFHQKIQKAKKFRVDGKYLVYNKKE